MRASSIAAILGAAAVGFAAGWYRDTRSGESPLSASRRRAPVEDEVAPRRPGFAIILPQLQTTDDCRSFLLAVEEQFARHHPSMRQAVRNYAMRRWLEIDAEGALTEAERLANNGFASDLFRVWLDLDVESAVRAWRQASPTLAREIRKTFLTNLAEKDPPRAFAEWQTPLGKGEQTWEDSGALIFRLWAQKDPHAAAEKAADPEHGRAIMEEWFRANPAEAATFVRSQKEGIFGLKILGPRILPELFRFDPAAAAEVIKLAGARGIGSSAAQQWTQVDPLGALNWAQNQPPEAPMVRDTLILAAGKLASSNPDRTIEILKSVPKASAGTDPAYGDFMTRVAYPRSVCFAGSDRFSSLPRTHYGAARDRRSRRTGRVSDVCICAGHSECHRAMPRVARKSRTEGRSFVVRANGVQLAKRRGRQGSLRTRRCNAGTDQSVFQHRGTQWVGQS